MKTSSLNLQAKFIVAIFKPFWFKLDIYNIKIISYKTLAYISVYTCI